VRKAAIVGTVVCAFAFFSGIATAETRFRGSFTLTFTRDCLARYVGETFNSTFRPARIGGNPNVTSLTQLNQYSGDVYELAGRSFALTVWHPVKGYGLDNLHYEFDARIRLTQLSPQTITPTTNFVVIVGAIERMGNDPGIGGKTCVAGFRGAYFRKVE
jgi:hypothetical protein